MKIVFFTKDPKNIHNVYPDWIKNALAKEAGADEIALVKIEEIEEKRDVLKDAEYIFSTRSRSSLTVVFAILS